MPARFLPAILASWCVLLVPASIEACSCVGGVSEFQSELKGQPLLIAGRIVGTIVPVTGYAAIPPDNVAAIEVQVLEVLRGKEEQRTVIVWDQFVNSSCSLELHKLEFGSFLLIALDPAEQPLKELWQEAGIKPSVTDRLMGTCRQPFRTFNSEAELRSYMKSNVRLRRSRLAFRNLTTTRFRGVVRFFPQLPI
jgi:hypothetical protein